MLNTIRSCKNQILKVKAKSKECKTGGKTASVKCKMTEEVIKCVSRRCAKDPFEVIDESDVIRRHKMNHLKLKVTSKVQ